MLSFKDMNHGCNQINYIDMRNRWKIEGGRERESKREKREKEWREETCI